MVMLMAPLSAASSLDRMPTKVETVSAPLPLFPELPSSLQAARRASAMAGSPQAIEEVNRDRAGIGRLLLEGLNHRRSAGPAYPDTGRRVGYSPGVSALCPSRYSCLDHAASRPS